MISANNITLRIGKKALFEDVNIKFTEGNCYGLIGANGAGKSTFLKILSGQLEPTNGDIAITPGQRLSFLQQDHFKYDEFTVLDTVIMGNKRLYDIMKEKEAIYMKEDFSDEDGIRASELEAEFADMDGWNAESDAEFMLNKLGVTDEYHYMTMAELPANLKVKVLLAQALFGNPDILLLDEPTNNLDNRSVAWLEDFLMNFPGTLIVVSHDRWFLDRVVKRIIEIQDGKAEFYSGNYSFYAVEKERRYLQNWEILCTFGAPFGKMQEWLNWPAWKASKPLKGFRGSNPLLSAACENRVASDLAARFLLRFRVSRRGFSGRGAPSLSRARRRAVPRRLRSASTRRSACARAGGRTRAGWRRAVSARSGCTAAA